MRKIAETSKTILYSCIFSISLLIISFIFSILFFKNEDIIYPVEDNNLLINFRISIIIFIFIFLVGSFLAHTGKTLPHSIYEMKKHRLSAKFIAAVGGWSTIIINSLFMLQFNLNDMINVFTFILIYLSGIIPIAFSSKTRMKKIIHLPNDKNNSN